MSLSVVKTSPLAALLAEIERSGSGSSAFWCRFWCDIDQLTEEELQRLLMAVGMRAKAVRLALKPQIPASVV